LHLAERPVQPGNPGSYVTAGGIDDNVLSVPGLVVAAGNSVPARQGQVFRVLPMHDGCVIAWVPA